jgi:hypothetical protein
MASAAQRFHIGQVEHAIGCYRARDDVVNMVTSQPAPIACWVCD